MCKEYGWPLPIIAEKSFELRGGETFCHYVNALSKSSRQWLYMRDSDSLVSFIIALALVCNGLDKTSFTDEQDKILTEVTETLYDPLTFFNHPAKDEMNNDDAYVPLKIRATDLNHPQEVAAKVSVNKNGDFESGIVDTNG